MPDQDDQACDECGLPRCGFRASVLEDPAICAGIARHEVVLERGAPLPVENAGDNTVWLVVFGAVMLDCVLPDGRRQVLAFVYPGEMLSPPSGAADLPCGAEALVQTRLCRVTVLSNDGGDALARLTIADDRARAAELTRRLVMLGRLTARERLARFLLDVARRLGKPLTDGLLVPLAMSRQDIADYLGLNAETVSRNFSRLRDDGLIALNTPHYAELCDVAALSDLVPLDGEMPQDEAGRSGAAAS